MSPIVLLFKSLIPAHTRRLKTGKVVNVRQYTDKRTKRLEDDKTLDMFADDDTITTPRQEMIDEHKRLVDVLESPSRKDDKVEAKKQKEELAGYEGKGESDTKAGMTPMDAAKYLKDVVYSLGNLDGMTDSAQLAMSSNLGKSGRDTLLMEAFNISREEAHDINNRLDDRKPNKLRAVDMEDAFKIFPGLQKIIDQGIADGKRRDERRASLRAKPADDTPKIEAKPAEAKAKPAPKVVSVKASKPKADAMAIGQRVTLARARHDKYVGMSGHVAAHIKSRGTVKIALDNGEYYEALPANIDAIDDGVTGAGYAKVQADKAKREAAAKRREERQEQARIEAEKQKNAAAKMADRVTSVMPGVPESDHKKIMNAVQRARRGNAGAHVVVSHYGHPFNYVDALPFNTLDAAQKYVGIKKDEDFRSKGTHGVFSPKVVSVKSA